LPELHKTAAFVLGSIRWQESSKIVSLYSRELGKIKVIARGALKPKSPFGGKLEALSLTEVVIAIKQGRSLQILTQADLLEPFNMIRQDLSKLPYALAMLEVINQTLDELHPDTVFFDFCLELFDSINRVKIPELVFCYFLLKLSSYLGFKPALEACSSCQKSPPETPVNFVLEKGVVYCHNCMNASVVSVILHEAEWRFVQQLQKHPHRRLEEFQLPLPQSRNITSLLIDFLNYHLDRKLCINALEFLLS
jgi:DNA repair protein RecO (recombination protein O)